MLNLGFLQLPSLFLATSSFASDIQWLLIRFLVGISKYFYNIPTLWPCLASRHRHWQLLLLLQSQQQNQGHCRLDDWSIWSFLWHQKSCCTETNWNHQDTKMPRHRVFGNAISQTWEQCAFIYLAAIENSRHVCSRMLYNLVSLEKCSLCTCCKASRAGTTMPKMMWNWNMEQLSDP